MDIVFDAHRSNVDKDKSIRKLHALMCDLAVRNDNPHCGSGLGGNNFQLLTLYNLRHNIVDGSNLIVDRTSVSWGIDCLLNNSLYTLRQLLDAEYVNMHQASKYLALALDALSDPDKLHEHLHEHENDYSDLLEVLTGNLDKFPQLSTNDQLVAAFYMCNELAKQLDNLPKTTKYLYCFSGGSLPPNVRKSVSNVGKVMGNFDPSIIILAVRRFINVQRIIEYALDEQKDFGTTLYSVVNVLNNP